jgi:flagellum-specific ATP synthase
MPEIDFDNLRAEIARLSIMHHIGRVAGVEGGCLQVTGLNHVARIGDVLRIMRREGPPLDGEVQQLRPDHLVLLPDGAEVGTGLGDPALLLPPPDIAPGLHWLGRVIDPCGEPLDGRPLFRGTVSRPLIAAPPGAGQRRGFGERLETGMAALNTLLPIVRGQRIGLFAGAGVGKSSLLIQLARHLQADVVVIALIGERGREVRHFVETALGAEGLARSVVVAATSDRSALTRRRCAWTAMAIAEHFRDMGLHVLLLADSITRFAEAHREIAIAGGEAASLRGFPASTAFNIMSLCERAGPGTEGQGDITAVFSVLVAGSDMDEPVADIMRGVLDGHVILDRAIAERGRYPAIDLLRSVSRSLPDAATEDQLAMISEVRQLLGAYQQSEVMIRSGLYSAGSDPVLDRAISIWTELDTFLAEVERHGISNSFARLSLLLRRSRSAKGNGATFSGTGHRPTELLSRNGKNE